MAGGGYEFGSGFVTVMPSARGFGRGLENELDGPFRDAGRRGGEQISDGVNQTGKGGFLAAGKGLGGLFAGAFAAVGGAAIVSAITDYVSSAISAASDLSETINKSGVIFGDNADDIQKWAAEAAHSVGLSKQAALDAASGFGDMFTQIGFAGDQAAAMAKDVVQLSADLGSFNNLPTAEVADKITSAFRGEYDSLQALIPNINGARVEQEALAASGKTVAAELTAAEKAAAVLAIVHADGAAAANDFAETSTGLANSQKILQADLENVKAEIGSALLPIATELFRVFAEEGVPKLQELSAWFMANKDAVGAMAIAVVDGGLAIIGSFLAIMEHQARMMDFWITVGTNMIQMWLNVAETVIDGAVTMFGWIPGVGEKLKGVQDAFGYLREDVDAKFTAIRAAADKSTQSFQDGQDVVSDLRDTIKSIDGMTATAKINIDTYERTAPAAGIPQARAMGGPVSARTPYWVGEREAELFVPDVSGRIYNQSQLASLPSGHAGGGGDTYVLQSLPTPDAYALAISRRQAMRGAV